MFGRPITTSRADQEWNPSPGTELEAQHIGPQARTCPRPNAEAPTVGFLETGHSDKLAEQLQAAPTQLSP